MGHTHAVFGLLCGMAALSFFDVSSPLLFVGLVVFGALLPDIDHTGSTINRIVPLTRLAAYLFTHRGFFHSVFPVVLLYIGFASAGLTLIGAALALGYLSHLAADSATKMGINFLYPLSTFKVQGFVETGGLFEFALFAMMGLFSLAWIIVWMGG